MDLSPLQLPVATEGSVLARALASGLIIVVFVILAQISKWVIGKQAIKLTGKTKSDIDDKIFSLLKTPVYYVIILIGLNIGLGSFLSGTPYADYFATGISVFVIILATWVAARIAKLFIEDVGKKLTAHTESTLDDEALPFISKIANLLIYVVGFMIIINQLGYSITPLVASLGIAGFAIGFAAQDSISNILAGFFIMVDRPFKIGDRIKIKDILGEVVDIGLRTTKVKTLDHLIVIIPNKSIVSDVVTNYTLPDMKLKVYLDVGVAYGSDPEKVKRICLKIADACELTLKDPAPSMYFLEFGESSLNFKLVVWVADFRDKWDATDHINDRILKELEKEGIEIPFPQRDIHIRSGKV
ncbi:MAG: mechanosensitive ion channel family protein [Candidatus Altiarchaeota archaeon]